MPTKKKAADADEAKPAKEVTELDPSDLGVGPDDPTYQKPAFGSEKELAVMDEDIDDRMAALLKDHQAMGVR